MAARRQAKPQRAPKRAPKRVSKKTGKQPKGKPVQFGEYESPDQIELEALKQARKNTSWIRIILTLVVLGAAFALPVAMGASSTATSSLDKVENYVSKSADVKPGKQAAMQAVNKWLEGDSSPFPDGVTSLIWDEARKTDTSTDGNGKTTVTWSHTFSFISLKDGTTRQCSQLVQISGGISTPTGTPSLLPLQASDSQSSSSSGTAPSGYISVDQSETLNQVIQQWAKAYVGKDSNALTVLVGDPNADHAYQPAAVGDLANVGTNWAVWNDPSLQKGETGEYAAVSVTISFTPYGYRKDDTKSRYSNASTDMCLLVKNPTSGSAKVVDWGADGYIKGLKPYRNAVDKSLIKTNTDDTTSSDSTTDGQSTDTQSQDGDTGTNQSADSGEGFDTSGDTNTDTNQNNGQQQNTGVSTDNPPADNSQQ